jgi:predicted CXXCH cytochrome family protein
MKRILYILPLFVVSISLAYRIHIDYGTIGSIVKSDQGIQEKECKFCHSNIVKHEVLHAPVSDDCTTCHQSNGNPHPKASMKGFTLAENEPELCFVCHEQNTVKSHIHRPVETGTCTSCHSPHGSQYPYLLSESTVSASCMNCHTLDLNKKSHVHAPIELEGCESCHDSHESDFDYLLVKDKRDLCIGCHDGIVKELKAEYIHPPFEDNCSNCHDAHASNESSLLTAGTPGMCYSCHGEIEAGLRESKYIHGPIRDGKNCSNCHSSHSSSHRNLLSGEGEEVCLNCHDKEIETEGRIIENLKEKIESSTFKHSAIETGGCASCHNAHSSSYASLLINSHPIGDYVDSGKETYELCFTCHDTGLLTEQFTEQATGFRNGNTNLHSKHSSGEKGRNCSICHDVHASGNKYLIKSRTTFGTWEMPMNFRLKENGGSCKTGCHIELSYDRIRTVIFEETNPTENVVTPIISIDTNQIVIDEHPIDTLKTDGNESTENTPLLETDTNQIQDSEIQKDTSSHDLNNVQTDIANNEIEIMDSMIEVQPDTSIHQTGIIISEMEEIKQVKKDSFVNETNVHAVDHSLNEEDFQSIAILSILFEYRSFEPKSGQDNTLKEVVEYLKSHPEKRIEIIGHTDEIGTSIYNMELSRKRAEAVKKLICDQGILPDRIKIKALGESQPRYSNEEAGGREKNRSVEFRLPRN